MSTHKRMNIICVVAIIFALILTVVVMNFNNLGVENSNKAMEYENKIFDTSKVHKINIEMDDWDGFIETCENEEYTACNVEIDDEVFSNVGIRAKGNTSLSNVSSMDSERYSFKLEFDKYNSGENYYGLDKLSLNNIIQDNTYMKDYLTYQMMNKFGVDSSLCSFVYITVNGEDWGLYLAAEGVEESFLQRNYGKDYGELYKPDSMEFGGGRGNGKDFIMKEFNKENGEDQDETADNSESDKAVNDESGSQGTESEKSNADVKNEGTEGQSSNNGSENIPPQWNSPPDGNIPQDGNVPQGGNMPQGGNVPPQGTQMNQSPDGAGENQPPEGFEPPELSQNRDNNNDAQSSSQSKSVQNSENSQDSQQNQQNNENTGDNSKENGFQQPSEMPDFENGGKGGGGFGSMNSSATLKYIDDEISSYSTIFDSAKTDVTKTDKKRLIASLKSLSEGEDLESVLDIEKLMRYFVVHNYVVNGDSYTGSMIHNYYLYEKDGQLSMIPWDYNLAFGGFQGNNATDAVNDPIDTPLNVSGDGSKPMIDWIFSSEEYTELYHKYFGEFLESVDIHNMIEDTYKLIAPYVEKDPTKFCTYEEFEKGVSTLKSFCKLRNESISAQLNGTIPSTDDGQKSDSSNLIDASSITISDMGTMRMDGGKMPDFNGAEMPDFNGKNMQDFNSQKVDGSSNTNTSDEQKLGNDNSSANENNVDSGDSSSGKTEESDSKLSSDTNNEGADSNSIGNTEQKSGVDVGERNDSGDKNNETDMRPGAPSDGNMPGGSRTESIFSKNNLILLGASLAVLIVGLLIAIRYRRR